MKKNKGKKAGIKSGVKAGVIVGIIVCLVWASSGPYPSVVDDGKGWHIVWEGSFAEAAEASPGAGASGILQIFFVNHSAAGNITENTSATIETWCDAVNLGYTSADDFNVELAHSVDFDIGLKVRANKTHAWRSTVFFDTDVRIRLTATDLSISADTVLSGVVLDNDTVDDYIWMMFETKADDTNGFSLSKDETADITSIKFECYY